MNWLNTFELMCYIIVAIMLANLIRRKDFDGLFTFGAATRAKKEFVSRYTREAKGKQFL